MELEIVNAIVETLRMFLDLIQSQLDFFVSGPMVWVLSLRPQKQIVKKLT
jgi:hypothetical protein